MTAGEQGMPSEARALAIITGASSGIGYELAKCCVRHGYDVLIAANDPKIHEAAAHLKAMGARAETIEADLSTTEGVDKLLRAVGSRAVDALLANAGRGLGRGFLDQEWDQVRHVVDTNIIGTLYLIQRIGRIMRARKRGRILITGSIAGFMPGAYQAVYNATKAFLDSFSFALRHEVAGDGVTITVLMPARRKLTFLSGRTFWTQRLVRPGRTTPPR